MVVQTFTLEGLSELLEAMEDLTRATNTNVLKRALANAGAPIESAAITMAPHFTGKLEHSITTSGALSRRQKQLLKKESQVEIYIGAGALVQAITQEFGTVHNKPRPFMRPAWENNKVTSLESIVGELSVEVEKARQRAERKAARILAKM